jgi:hypothetical protein
MDDAEFKKLADAAGEGNTWISFDLLAGSALPIHVEFLGERYLVVGRCPVSITEGLLLKKVSE